MTEALGEVLGHLKSAAVHHRNNYIGTEHLLSGLTATEDTATRLLAAADVEPARLHATVTERLVVGASQAAERIAWTPYSRRTIALAEELSAADGAVRIECDHLLLGLAQLGRGVAAAVLDEAGVDVDALHRARSGAVAECARGSQQA